MENQNQELPPGVSGAIVLNPPPTPQTVHECNGLRSVVLPPGYTVHEIDDEKLHDVPRRKQGTFKVHDRDSFIRHINTHKVKDSDEHTITTLWANLPRQQNGMFDASSVALIAIFNDHGASLTAPEWRDHRAIYAPAWSVELYRWLQYDRKDLSQEQFALFLEDNIDDIHGEADDAAKLSDQDLLEGKLPESRKDTPGRLPTGAEMFAMARELEITKDFKVKSAIDPTSGNIRLEYIDEENGETQKRTQAFARFAIRIPIFDRGEPYIIEARLRHRSNQGKVAFRYELIRPDRAIQSGVDDLCDSIKTATGLADYFYYGAP